MLLISMFVLETERRLQDAGTRFFPIALHTLPA
jgi:hypothetical protein